MNNFRPPLQPSKLSSVYIPIPVLENYSGQGSDFVHCYKFHLIGTNCCLQRISTVDCRPRNMVEKAGKFLQYNLDKQSLRVLSGTTRIRQCISKYRRLPNADQLLFLLSWSIVEKHHLSATSSYYFLVPSSAVSACAGIDYGAGKGIFEIIRKTADQR